jgi:2-phospho-L-lactate guanylyltransferase
MSHAFHAIVPVKSLALAKSRLSELLGPAERRALALAMLEDVLAMLRFAPDIERVGVVSRDAAVLRAARAAGADVLLDRAPGLNEALAQADDHYARMGAGARLLIHADLPLATADEIGMLAAALREGADVALAPARDGGTNALAYAAERPLPPMFGGASLARHLAGARERGLSARMVRARGLERDIDRPEDLIWLAEQPGERAAQRYTRALGILQRVACV